CAVLADGSAGAGVTAQDSERKPDLVVERADGGDRRPAAFVDLGEQVLRRRLAGRAGDTHDVAARQRGQDGPGQLTECGGRVGDDDRGRVDVALRNCGDRTGGDSSSRAVVTVDPSP